MASELTEDRQSLIDQKQADLNAMEESYYQKTKAFEAEQAVLGERFHSLTKCLKHEADNMAVLLNHYQSSPDIARDFYQTIQELEEESTRTYRKVNQDLELAREDYCRNYSRQVDELYQELHTLRRTQDDTHH